MGESNGNLPTSLKNPGLTNAENGKMDFLEALEATLKDYIEITPVPATEIGASVSRTGGIPFLPSSVYYPRSADGKAMNFLAQINFGEIPQFSPFPTSGLLQFYQSDEGDVELIYIPEDDLSNLVLQSWALSDIHYPLLQNAHALVFVKKRMSVPNCDHGFNDVYDELFITEELAQKFEDFYFSYYSRQTDHRIGGNPSFLDNVSCDKILLFQLALGIDPHWGGTEVNSFYISESHLKALDFSAVHYHRHSH